MSEPWRPARQRPPGRVAFVDDLLAESIIEEAALADLGRLGWPDGLTPPRAAAGYAGT